MTIAALIFITMLSLSNEFQNEFIGSIAFEDKFEQDTLSLNINGICVLEKIVINSDKSLGITGSYFKIYNNGINIVAKYRDQEEFFIPIKGQICFDLEIELNGVYTEFKIMPENGKYIGLNKVNGTVVMRQSKIMFIYD